MKARAPLLVGILLIVAVGVLAYFVSTTSKNRFSGAGTYLVYADFVDASGVRWKTRVQINGIDVGKVESIGHHKQPDGRLIARVALRISKDFKLYSDASVKKVAESLLGDFRLDLDPGTEDHPLIAEGGVITKVQSKSDLDQIQHDLSHLIKNISSISDNVTNVLGGAEGKQTLKDIMDSVKETIAAIQTTATVLATATSNNQEVIDRTIKDIGQISHQLAKSTESNGDLTAILAHTASLAAKLDSIAGASLTEGGTRAEETNTLKSVVARLSQSVERLNSIVSKIDQGTGTAGRLVNDPAIADKIEDALDGAGEVLSTFTRLQAEVELRSEYGVPVWGSNKTIQSGIKNVLALRLYPRPDKYFGLELISDPRGVQRRKVTSVTSDSTGGATVEDQTVTTYNDLRFTAEFAKRYYFTQLRFGIIENTGGLGVNFFALKDHLEWRFDAFDFNRRDITKASQPLLPRLRGRMMYHFLDHAFVQAGLDDPLNHQLFTWFVGGGIRFTDDDIRSLLLVAPTPSLQQ
jgi:phospholipid/cholesterol/gamma-HCH transport system substrate-binding protein